MHLASRACTAAALFWLAACSSGESVPNEQATANNIELAPVPDASSVEANLTSEASPSTAAEAVPSPSPTPSASAASETIGGDGSAIRLDSLQADDGADVAGELGCTFNVEGQNGAILLAKADVGKAARAQAVVRNHGEAERLLGRTAGGFGALERGTTSLGGRGLTIDIAPQQAVPTSTEEVRQRATLVAKRGDGAERRYQGLWSCGP